MEALDLILVLAAGWTVLLMLVVAVTAAASRADDATDEFLAGVSRSGLEPETVTARVRTRQTAGRKVPIHFS